jgi:uncharacterized protein (DUF1778 family)
MKLNRLGNWQKETRLTIRLTESVRDAIAKAAVEDGRSMAQTVTGVLTAWCIARETEQNKVA